MINYNTKIIILAIIGLVIGFVIAWLIFSEVNTTGNATKSINNNELNSTIATIMAKGVKEGSNNATYVKSLLTNNGYSTTDGRTYTNKTLNTTTVICYLGDDLVGGDCTGACKSSGDNCTNNGCRNIFGCSCDYSGTCLKTSGNCSMGGGAALE